MTHCKWYYKNELKYTAENCNSDAATGMYLNFGMVVLLCLRKTESKCA